MKKNYILFTFILFANLLATGQNIKISGKLLNANEKNIISNGVLFLNPGNQVTASDEKGEYSFFTTPGIKHIISQVLGYKNDTISFEAKSDTAIDIFIQLSPFELKEVTITGESKKNIIVTSNGSVVLTSASMRETPRLFSQPDLLKSLQVLPGVVAGKDGSSDIFVRGGSTGQNIVLANGCYFFLPGHLLGVISPYDLDFLESAELFKDYFPTELGGGASSVINLDFIKVQSDSMHIQLRLGLLSSGITFELPLKSFNWGITAGLNRGNYSLYAPLLKKLSSSNVGDFLPSDNYTFYDGFLKLSHTSLKWGNFNYLFFGNYDNGKNENKNTSEETDTLINYTDGISTGWNSMVHALQWDLHVKNKLKWKFNLNYNRLSMGRNQYIQTEKFLDGVRFYNQRTTYSFTPEINSFGFTAVLNKSGYKLSWTAGISNRLRYFSPNIITTNILNNSESKNKFGETSRIFEPAAFVSSTLVLSLNIQFEAGLRLSGGFTPEVSFMVLEPRLRLSFFTNENISPHFNYVRLSQFEHSIEGSNAGLRTMLMLPVFKNFGPEISDVYSSGFLGRINNDFVWTLDGYYKKTSGMLDYKPGASFIFDTSFDDMLESIEGRAYGLETGIIKRTGKLTGSVSYTYSKSRREWIAPEGLIWIPSNADRPHNFNLLLRYYFKKRTIFGLNWVFQSGLPATIYMHNATYGEWFETKNNIRYFDYHRLDLSVRQILYKKRLTISIDADIYNVYNHKNTFYFKEIYDEAEKKYYFKNISLFPIMPSITLTIKY